MQRMASFTLSAVLALPVSTPCQAEDRLSVTVSPNVGFSPMDVRIKVRIEPNGENRALEIVAESPEFFRSSEQPLNGVAAPRVTAIEFRNLPAGDYLVTTTLRAANKTVAIVRRMFSVVADQREHTKH
jgi:hypothetical protein